MASVDTDRETPTAETNVVGGGGRQGTIDGVRYVAAPQYTWLCIAALLCCDVVWCGLSGGSSQ